MNLDAGNRLINFRRSETGMVEIAGPPPAVIVGALRSGGEHGFAGEGEFFRTGLDAQALGTILRRLMRKARQDFLDRGVDALHLSVGMLRWRDEEGTAYASPLLLLPVELTAAGPADLPRLTGRDDDPVVNPALVLRMRLLGVDLPAVDSLAELDLAEFLTRTRAATAGRDGWRVDEQVLLSTFSFHKEAMYRDLHDNEDRILNHPVIRNLAALDGEPAFAPIAPADVDELAPPEEVPLVLDADASQRACIAAATAGHSFVLDGPPGTGKSLTIANMIGCLMHAGKRVLFVSEKAAALEVVRNRLADVGLDGYLLELHSHKATRKEVARGLADALDAPRSSPAAGKVGAARASREALSAYADAMNEVREPLGSSLHDILGRCAELASVPAGPPPRRPHSPRRRCGRSATPPTSWPGRGGRPRSATRSPGATSPNATRSTAGCSGPSTPCANCPGRRAATPRWPPRSA